MPLELRGANKYQPCVGNTGTGYPDDPGLSRLLGLFGKIHPKRKKILLSSNYCHLNGAPSAVDGFTGPG